MIRIRWTTPAADDLESIRIWLDESHPQFAAFTIRAIYDRIKSLRRFPARGRPGRREGTREMVLSPLPYIVVYAVVEDVIEILHIAHGARKSGSVGV